MKLEQKTLVTLGNLPANTSNVFTVDSDEGETALLTHPLLPNGLLLRVEKRALNTVQPNIKDSTERCLDFANSNGRLLDYNTVEDLVGLSIVFGLKRKLTPRQKQTLANICGLIATVKFNNDIKETMSFIMKNQGILDEFNLMWFSNFKGLFSGRQPITSKKQRGAIFNIAGYLLAELENPTAQTRK